MKTGILYPWTDSRVKPKNNKRTSEQTNERERTKQRISFLIKNKACDFLDFMESYIYEVS